MPVATGRRSIRTFTDRYMTERHKQKTTGYGDQSITALKGADRVRLRPGVIFGSDGIEGCQHTFIEILANSIDEAREGFGKTIEVFRRLDLSITVQDHGRGCPVGYNEKEKRYNWELVFCELYAGGKYNNLEGESYEYSLGLNGIGCCATQYASEFMDVTIRRDGCRYDLHFEKGINIGGMQKTPLNGEPTGTVITWKPDRDVFTAVNLPLEFFQDVLKKQAVINPGVTFLLHDEETAETYRFFYQNGLTDYINEISQSKEITPVKVLRLHTRGRDREDKPEYKLKAEIAFCFNNAINRIEYYHNSSFLEHGGAPDRAVKSGFTYAIDQYLKSNRLYNKNEKKISFSDIEDSLILLSSSFSTITSYENQTKKAITNRFIQQAMSDFLKNELEVYFIENKEAADTIMSQMLVNKRSREKAEQTRISIKKKLGKKVDMHNQVKKFVNCRTRDKHKRELYIVEGDSALGACKLGRDADFQALMPVRGKILNCLKTDLDRIFKNDIIVDLLKVIGCGVEIPHKAKRDLHTFDLNKLRWSKIIIATDADVDGFQIRTLILTMIYRLLPSLLEHGKIFIVESPLFEIRSGKNTLFAYNEKEKKEIVKSLKGSYTLQRSKGLGENEPDMMWRTTMNPKTRRLLQVVPDAQDRTDELFQVLLGEALEARKQYIADNGGKYLDWIDVS